MKALREQLAAQGVHTLLVQFTDLHGVARGKLVPLAHLDTVLTSGAGFSGPSIWGTGLPRTGERSEYYARGDRQHRSGPALDAGRGAHRRRRLRRRPALRRLPAPGAGAPVRAAGGAWHWTLQHRHRARVLPAAARRRPLARLPTRRTSWTSPATT
jgi:hypothetical protein